MKPRRRAEFKLRLEGALKREAKDNAEGSAYVDLSIVRASAHRRLDRFFDELDMLCGWRADVQSQENL